MGYVESLVSTPNGLAAIKAAIQSWRSSESTAYDMLDTIFNVLDRDKGKSSGVISRLVDLLEGERKDELVEAWGGMKAEPARSNTPTMRAVAPGGMDYAGISSGRVINVKHSTRGRTFNARTPIWDRVEQAASSSSRVPFGNATSILQPRLVPGATARSSSPNRFPALPTSTARPSPSPIWGAGSGPSTSAAARTPAAPMIRSVNVSTSKSSGRGTDGPNLSKSAFPQLPSVKDDLPTNFITAQTKWQKPPPSSSWGSSKGNSRAGTGDNQQPPTSSTKAGKKKGKETLFTLGGLPT